MIAEGFHSMLFSYEGQNQKIFQKRYSSETESKPTQEGNPGVRSPQFIYSPAIYNFQINPGS